MLKNKKKWFKAVCRVVVTSMIIQAIPEVAQAATGNVTTMVSKAFAPAPKDDSHTLVINDWIGRKLIEASMAEQQKGSAKTQKTAEPEKRPVPELKGFIWKNLGDSPLIPSSMLPNGYGSDEVSDTDTLQRIANCEPGFQEACNLFWSAVDLVFFRGTGVNPRFKERLIGNIMSDKMKRLPFPKGTLFQPCGMAWGTKSIDGVYRARFTGNPLVDFDEPLEVYLIDPIKIESGPYEGHVLSPVIPVKCVNLTCMYGEQVTEKYPVAPPPPTQTVKVKKTWLNVRGKKTDAPAREDVQLRFEAVPVNGGKPIVAEALDNKTAELTLEEGRQYTIRELLDSAQWRVNGKDEVTVTIGEDNDDVKFENIQVRSAEETNAFVNCPPGGCREPRDGETGPRGPRGKEGRTPWKKIIIGGAIGGLVVGLACTQLCGKTTNNNTVVQPVKGGPGSPNNAGVAP